MKYLAAITLALATFLLPGAASAEAPRSFTLEPAAGTTTPFESTKHRGKYVALHFLLKTECPICMRHTRDYFERADEVAGVDHVFIKPDAVAATQAWASKMDETVPVYRDANAQLAKQFDIPDGYEFHGETVHYPALILLGPDGTEVFRYVGKNNSDRYSFESFKTKMEQLRRPKGIAHYHLPKDSTLALKGYDPVAYFTENVARKGNPNFVSTYEGVTYHFATEANRRLFAGTPEKYLPTYGGWCATAMADGDKVDIDPANFKVTEGRLFLFYSGIWGDASKKWNKNEAALETAADTQWAKLVE